ncbi:MAG: hypothetical protein AB8B53_10570 [Flavobacteriales bacterium]
MIFFYFQNLVKCLLTAVIVLCFNMVSTAQITEGFSSDNTILYQVDGDGSVAYNTNGNPDGCLRIDEIANNQLHHLILPNQFLGDWSDALTSDFLSLDIYVQSLSGGQLDRPYVFEISGPQGMATSFPDYQLPSLAEWHTLAVNLNPADWTVISGTWAGILEEVELVRIRTEFIQGDEFGLVDNINLSFSPSAPDPISEGACSTFESFGGWDFEGESSSIIVSNAGGMPPAMRLTDLIGSTTFGIAPPSFTGDWSVLDNNGLIEFDIKIESNNAPVTEKDILILTGADGSQATFIAPVVNTNDWQTFTAPIDEDEWQMTSGTWSGLLANVAQVRLGLEFVIGGETVYLDNFCVNTDGVIGCDTPSVYIPNELGESLYYGCSPLEGYVQVDECFENFLLENFSNIVLLPGGQLLTFQEYVNAQVWDNDFSDYYELITTGCVDFNACNYLLELDGLTDCSDNSSCLYGEEPLQFYAPYELGVAPLAYSCSPIEDYFPLGTCFSEYLLTLGSVDLLLDQVIWDEDIYQTYLDLTTGCADPLACNYLEVIENFACSDNSTCLYNGVYLPLVTGLEVYIGCEPPVDYILADQSCVEYAVTFSQQCVYPVWTEYMQQLYDECGLGCTDPADCNYDPEALYDDGSCAGINAFEINIGNDITQCDNGTFLIPAFSLADFLPVTETWQIISGTASISDEINGIREVTSVNVGESATVQYVFEYEGCYSTEELVVTNIEQTCGDPFAVNFTFTSVCGANDSCIYEGCTDETALNYNPLATISDSSCLYDSGSGCPGDLNGDNQVTISDLSGFLAAFGTSCE